MKFFYEPDHPQSVLPTVVQQRLPDPAALILIQSTAHHRLAPHPFDQSDFLSA